MVGNALNADEVGLNLDSAAEALATGVVIVGGGPVGMGLAIELGQRGVPCIVVERYPAPQRVPKGQNLTQRTMEHFHYWGVEESVRKARVIPKELGIKGLTAYGNLLSDYYYDWFQRDKVAQYYLVENERLPQYKTEEVLRERVAQLDCVKTLYGFDCISVENRGAGVGIEIQHRDSGSVHHLSAEYVVGCDGSHSVVRRSAGISQVSDDHEKRMVLLVFKSVTLHKLLERYPGKSYFNVINPELDGYWQFFGRVDFGETFFFHAPVDTSATTDNTDYAAFLDDIVGESIKPEFQYIGFWDLRIATASQYSKGRIFLAGDAAHSHPPYGGFGINTGFEDARNLGWKLSAVFEGWAGEHLLSSYDEERRPVFQSTADKFINRYIETDREFIERYNPETDRNTFERAWERRSQGSDFDVVGFAPHYSGSRLIRGDSYPDYSESSGANASHDTRARAGHHLTPLPLDSSTNVYDALGTGYTLLVSSLEHECAAQFESAASAQGVPLTVVEINDKTVMDQYQATAVLIRPDHYVAWVKR